ncbi:MAG: NAD(P)/FAD-dependent oxidoreductase [Microthrixaceae bacterium]
MNRATGGDRVEPGDEPDVVVVGAGLSGLAAARTLEAHGVGVTVLDKGRSVGGRLATRRILDARLDHGAQFFTQRGPEMAALVAELDGAGVLRTWCRGFGVEDGHPRYVVEGGMNGLAKYLAAGLRDVRTGTEVLAVHRVDGGWRTEWDGGSVTAPSLLLTAPVPQTLALLDRGGVELDPGIRPALETVDYDAAIALLVVLDGPPALPSPGAVKPTSGPFGFVADNAARLGGGRHALTLHCTPRYSRTHLDDDPERLAEQLLRAALPWTGGAGVAEVQVKTWRYAAPRQLWPEPCCVAVDGDEPLVLAGDAFDGPRVEGAYVSGLAAAVALRRGRLSVGA